MKQPFLLDFLRTYPTKRIAKKLLEKEAVIITNAERVSPEFLGPVLSNIRKLAFDPLIVIPAHLLSNTRRTIQDCLLRSEVMAGLTNLPIYNEGMHNNGIVPCISSTETGWTAKDDIDTIRNLSELHAVTKIYRFQDTRQSKGDKRSIKKETSDKLTNLLLADNMFKSTVVDIDPDNPGELLRHCTIGKLNSGVEYRRGISIVENNFVSKSLRYLLENSFDRKFKNWGQYEQELSKSSVYVAGNYFGTAIVHNLSNDISYLDKFAVNVNQQSTGVAELLWNHLRRNHNVLAWRSRVDNPANSWYLTRSDGSFTLNDKWKLFWYGDLQSTNFDHLQKLIDDIPATFSETNFSK